MLISRVKIHRLQIKLFFFYIFCHCWFYFCYISIVSLLILLLVTPSVECSLLLAPLYFLLISFLTFNHQFISFLGENSHTNEYVLPVTHTRAKLWEHMQSHTHTHMHTASVQPFSPALKQQDNTVILGSRSKTHSICLYPSLTVRLRLSVFWCLWKHRYYPLFMATSVTFCTIEERWRGAAGCVCPGTSADSIIAVLCLPNQAEQRRKKTWPVWLACICVRMCAFARSITAGRTFLLTGRGRTFSFDGTGCGGEWGGWSWL